MWRGQRWLPMETSGFAPNAELKPFPGHLLPLHAHSAPWEANNYLPSVPLNKESEKKQRFRTSRAAYHFLQSRAGFWRVIRLQVTDSRACDEILPQKHLASKRLRQSQQIPAAELALPHQGTARGHGQTNPWWGADLGDIPQNPASLQRGKSDLNTALSTACPWRGGNVAGNVARSGEAQ